jgi:hypothetical protein
MRVAVDTLPSRFEAVALEMELERTSIDAEVAARDDGWVVLVDDRPLERAQKRVADLRAQSSTTRGSLRDVDDAVLEVVGLGITAATHVPRPRAAGRFFWLFMVACGVIAWWLA